MFGLQRFLRLVVFLEEIELDPEPEMVAHPRENPYVFYEEYFEEDEDEEEEE